jgi:Uma2 family endonuclease
MAVTIELENSQAQTAFNKKRWEEVLVDRRLAGLPERIETDRYGHIIMSPPPGVPHGIKQNQIGKYLADMLPEGSTISECPISTLDGVKAADVAWVNPSRQNELTQSILLEAADICVEIFSPGNTRREILEKKALYFEAGAKEVWICELDGKIEFYLKEIPDDPSRSKICPAFPEKI